MQDMSQFNTEPNSSPRGGIGSFEQGEAGGVWDRMLSKLQALLRTPGL